MRTVMAVLPGMVPSSRLTTASAMTDIPPSLPSPPGQELPAGAGDPPLLVLRRHVDDNVQMTSAVAGAAPESSDPLLRVSALAVRFGPLRALDGVGLAVRPGELVGPSGEDRAGTTPLLRLIPAGKPPTNRE